MDRFIWESERSVQDVLSSFTALTDKPTVIDRALFEYKSFAYKLVTSDEYQFTLWCWCAARRASYHPAPFRGIIKATSTGCRVEAHPQKWISIADSTLLCIFILICYIAAAAAPFAGFKGWLVVSIMFGALATGILARFLYTRKKWIAENKLLSIINCATNVKSQQRS